MTREEFWAEKGPVDVNGLLREVREGEEPKP
jgi:hypothetical protein